MNLEKNIETCYKIYTIFEDMLDSYVSDYYVEEHWSKLPKSWQQYFVDVDPKQLSNLLDFDAPLVVTPKLLPLSLLCLRLSISKNVLSRRQTRKFEAEVNVDVPKFFWKGVKAKKIHEISIMARTCYHSAVKTNCFNIVDVGSGLGHLSRLLSYQFGLRVCTFEADKFLSCSAVQLDRKLEEMLYKRDLIPEKKFKTVHINQVISPHLKKQDFLGLVKEAFGSENDMKFGIIGLHPCGDLGSTLLNLYAECCDIVFLNIASCCYMKLTLEPSVPISFPLSLIGKDLGIKLSYLSCEIACHAIENFVEKLVDSCQLKIHAYRAGLEQLLVDINPQFRHSKICSVKYNDNLSFSGYVKKAIKHFHDSPGDNTISKYGDVIEKTWRNVVTFYSLRLLLAPLVETIVLLDRLLYVKECNGDCELLPLFDCSISPRCHVLIASKNKYS